MNNFKVHKSRRHTSDRSLMSEVRTLVRRTCQWGSGSNQDNLAIESKLSSAQDPMRRTDETDVRVRPVVEVEEGKEHLDLDEHRC